jgi:hypothetical protein
VDALLDGKPSRAEPFPRLLAPGPHRRFDVQRAKGVVIVTMVVFLGVVMMTCLIGVAVIPRFDRRVPLSPPDPVVAAEPRAAPSWSA